MKVSLSVTEAMPLSAILSSQLDGYEKVIKGPDGNDKSVSCLFELGVARLDIAKNANRVKAIIEEFDAVRTACIKRLADGNDTITKDGNPEAFQAFLDEITPMAEQKSEVELVPIKRSALKLETNPIPISALMLLERHGLLVD